MLATTASMGPHSSECGNVETPRKSMNDSTGLQWGRTHLSAETPHFAGVPSGRAGVLQWGRTHLSAETRSAIPGHPSAISLQWGRTHLSAET